MYNANNDEGCVPTCNPPGLNTSECNCAQDMINDGNKLVDEGGT